MVRPVMNILRSICFLVIISGATHCFAQDDSKKTIGALLTDLELLQNQLGAKAPKKGALVVTAEPAGGFDVKPMDIITHVNLKPVVNVEELVEQVQSLPLDKKSKLSIQRMVDGKWKKMQIEGRAKEYKDVVLGNMTEEKDDVTGTILRKDKRSPDSYISNNLQCFIATKDGKDTIVLRVSFNGKDWIFFKKVIVKAKEQDEAWELEFPQTKTDHNGKMVWEWVSRVASDEDLGWLKLISKSNNVTLRYVGPTYTRDRELDLDEIAAIRNVLEAYRIRGAK